MWGEGGLGEEEVVQTSACRFHTLTIELKRCKSKIDVIFECRHLGSGFSRTLQLKSKILCLNLSASQTVERDPSLGAEILERADTNMCLFKFSEF